MAEDLRRNSRGSNKEPGGHTVEPYTCLGNRGYNAPFERTAAVWNGREVWVSFTAQTEDTGPHPLHIQSITSRRLPGRDTMMGPTALVVRRLESESTGGLVAGSDKGSYDGGEDGERVSFTEDGNNTAEFKRPERS